MDVPNGMNILLHIGRVRAYGSGNQTMLGNLATELVKLGRNVSVEGDFSENPVLLERLRQIGVEVLEFGFSRKGLFDCFSFVRSIRWRRYDVVVSSGLSCDARLTLLRPFIRASLVTVFQENPYTSYAGKGWWGKLLAFVHVQVVSLCFDRVVCISQYVRQSIMCGVKLREKVFVTIYNGVDVEYYKPRRVREKPKFWGVDHGGYRHVVGLAGRLSAEKRPEMIFTLAKMMEIEMGEEGKKILYVVVGDGVMREKLEIRAKEFPKPDRFRFVGSLENMAEAYNHMDVLVHFRRDEGFGLVLVEAMACEVPVVVLSGSGVDEIISSSEDGYLINLEDQLPHRVARLLGNSGERKSIAERSRKKVVDRFSLRRQAELYDREFRILSSYIDAE